jgi:hypothetical protein
MSQNLLRKWFDEFGIRSMYRRIKVDGFDNRGGAFTALSEAQLRSEEQFPDEFPEWMRDFWWDDLKSLHPAKGKFYWTEEGWRKYGLKTIKILNWAYSNGVIGQSRVVKIKEKDVDVYKGDRWQVSVKSKNRIRDRRISRELLCIAGSLVEEMV